MQKSHTSITTILDIFSCLVLKVWLVSIMYKILTMYLSAMATLLTQQKPPTSLGSAWCPSERWSNNIIDQSWPYIGSSYPWNKINLIDPSNADQIRPYITHYAFSVNPIRLGLLPGRGRAKATPPLAAKKSTQLRTDPAPNKAAGMVFSFRKRDFSFSRSSL